MVIEDSVIKDMLRQKTNKCTNASLAMFVPRDLRDNEGMKQEMLMREFRRIQIIVKGREDPVLKWNILLNSNNELLARYANNDK